MYCAACGAANLDSSRFCAACGAALVAAPAAVLSPAAASPVAAPPPALDQRRQVANYWHTLALIVFLLFMSFTGSARVQNAAQRTAPRPALYASIIFMQWTMLGYVYLGVRRRNISLRQLTGNRWRGFDDVLLDVVLAIAFWFAVALLLALLGKALGLAEHAAEMRKSLAFMTPTNALELALWSAVAASAGICEEIIFRGYLQRQMASLSGNLPLGVLASALIFGASHGYEGGARMLLVGLLGLALGVLAAVRKNLRPGMIAHAWQDLFAGFGLFFMRRMGL